ncbi:hypothetical protein DPMN_097149 [Dreissena polymorpha]|uniref:Uncharacterized protein n=1 Tax=Dreissena polymorpha TaxID=45954 RepID=A0A9D4LB61_DREPO|nr:hypothetical protein DPMN_097149 [Dreissena polymorpha]
MENVDMTSRFIKAYVRSGEIPYKCDAKILFSYTGNIVSYNIVSESVDVIAYERFNAKNCSMMERYVR